MNTFPKRESNLGLKCLSLLEFEMWGLRLLDPHDRFENGPINGYNYFSSFALIDGVPLEVCLELEQAWPLLLV